MKQPPSTLAPIADLPSGHDRLPSLGILECLGWTASLVALDAMAKGTNIRVVQAEWNDMLGSVIKIAGSVDEVEMALAIGRAKAASFFPDAPNGNTIVRQISSPDQDALRAILSPDEYNALIEQPVVKQPAYPYSTSESSTMSSPTSLALGFIETQGFTAVFEAIDTACKSAAVEVVGKEKLGGGYVTVVIRGDVAAVNAAIEAAKPKVEGLGKLIACHVIARPSQAALGLLPK
ncbi:BMC domain-containing protein [Pirellulaceae bacterium SH467]